MDAAGYRHLLHLSTSTGVYEHALGAQPRVEHGMCTDDVARALVVTARAAEPPEQVLALSRTCLAYLLRAQASDGRMHNRSDETGRWLDEPSTDDHWGRAVWAFGVAAACSTDPHVADGARRGAARALLGRSPHPRAMAYAALGAAQLARVLPGRAPHRLLRDAREVLPRWVGDEGWAWPYERLTYANAVLPEAMIAVGSTLADPDLLAGGLQLLAWLQAEQTVDGHLSMVPAGGRGRGDGRPGYDQQPIEVAAMAEAAVTAWTATGDPRWVQLLARCEAWFTGDNDAGLAVREPDGGGGYDGLEDGSVNQNQGAESTLAWLATRQLAAGLVPAATR